MLAVYTAEDNLYVPDLEIASLTPVHPNRTRVVLADGRVAHRAGPPPPGPWVPLHDSWVLPHHLTRRGDSWRDPAGYLYPYQPLAALELDDEEPELPEDLIAFESHQGQYHWRSDSGLEPADFKPAQVELLYPQMCKVGATRLINTRRVRRFGMISGNGARGWFDLDNGERIEFTFACFPGAYRALGVDSLAFPDTDQPPVLRRLRDFPYDLTSADPERIRQDCPTAQDFLYNLLWQTVLQNLRGQTHDYGRDPVQFAAHPLIPAGRRCGFKLVKRDLDAALIFLVNTSGLFQLRQLGFQDDGPTRALVGSRRPELLLVTPNPEAERLARRLGISLLLSQRTGDRLQWETLVPQLPTPLLLLFHGLTPAIQQKSLRILEQLDVEWLGQPLQLKSLAELETQLPPTPSPPTPVPFRRIPLQAGQGQLLMATPQEIASWTPTRYARWRVVLADGQVLHHPGPIPPGLPRVQAAHLQEGKDPAGFPQPLECDALPPQPTDPELPEHLLQTSGGACWQLDDGSRHTTSLDAETAARLHPGLVRVTRKCWVHPNRIRHTSARQIVLDSGTKIQITASQHSFRLSNLLEIPAFDRLGPDLHQLLQLGIRDFPFELARASAELLRRHFANANQLIANLLYQSYDMYESSGILPYGDSFSAYFYRPLQATLYRAGFLTRSQLRAPWRALSAKERLRILFHKTIFAMVYHHKLFTYRQFGFKDPAPRDRILGSPKILLVEKGSDVEAFARRLQQETGVTLVVLEGAPSLLATEHTAEALKQAGIREVEVHFYGDFDYAGWDIGPAYVRQLRFCGIGCTRLTRLVLPECFSPEELALFSRPLEATAPNVLSRIQRWLRESGGLHGQARGIHANWLFPYERLQARWAELQA
ncbi:hypothetical protein ABS71_17905 [bacterium SCN 62-11]|nr:MAG: hypothetical protein ABS71_17905 [bacterium SCN 62-11]